MSSQPVPTDRYDDPAPWWLWALIAVFVVLAMGVAVVVVILVGLSAFVHSTPDVESRLIGFETVDEHTSTAVVEVDFGADDVVATCLLRALAEDHSVVGELSFTAEPAAGTRYEETVRTERRATAVDLVGCTTSDQPRPR